jgi:4-alpha-glucanotransferase
METTTAARTEFLELPLARLASRLGIELDYLNASKHTVAISSEVICALLAAMNLPTNGDTDAQNHLDDLDRKEQTRRLPAVMVVRVDQQPFNIPLRFESSEIQVFWRLIFEDGSDVEGTATKASLTAAEAGADGDSDRRILVMDSILPLGYHRLEIAELGISMPLIVVPRRCWLPSAVEHGAKIWGLAVQLYLIRSASNWGVGDFSDLLGVIESAAGWGADLIGLNPLHALFLDDPSQVSPYSPASRLFLNIHNIDVTNVPEFTTSLELRLMIESAPLGTALAESRAASLLDYETASNLKLEALRILFRSFQNNADPKRKRNFHTFVKSQNPALEQFCAFQLLRMEQAKSPAAGADWRHWPEDLRRGDSAAVERFAASHREEIEFLSWTQWIADNQLAEAATTAKNHGMAVGLYRDLAVGAHGAGAETWSQPDTVVSRAHAGAPPDLLNTDGQDWGLPPFSPNALRETGYAAFIALVRANMRHAGALRIDHVVGLQHLYWVPEGRSPAEGAYVTYPFNDLAGILALESCRNQCLVVGEDLGTVPPGFRERIAELGILSSKVLYFEQNGDTGEFLAPEEYPVLSLASVGTHDLATLGGWWDENDIKLRETHQLYSDPEEGARQHRHRRAEKRNLLEALEKSGLDPGDGSDKMRFARAVHSFLGSTNAAVAMIQMEDLIGTTMQVNLPGTTNQYPNWRRRLTSNIESIVKDPRVNAIVEAISNARRNRK